MSRFVTFLSDRQASVSQVIAFAMLPLMGTLGLGVDYANVMHAKTEMQGVLDSTVLRITREAPKNDAAALKLLAEPYFAALAGQYRNIAAGSLAVTKTDTTVNASTTATVKTYFGGVYAFLGLAGGTDQLTVTVRSQANYATRNIELAMVLDNTGSMNDFNKIGELRKASHSLLATLEKSAVKADQIKVALVPYTTRVNLGTTFKDQAWLTTTPTGSFLSSYKIPASRNLWQGCVADRDTGYNASANPVSVAVPQSLYPMVNCTDGVTQAMPLTADWKSLNARVDLMHASGNTNITLGAQWGFEMLSSAAPFTEASNGANVERFMILLTDGMNTQDRWGVGQEARMNKDTQAMCDAITERSVAQNAKKLNITLYTILVLDGNEALLKSCASSPDKFIKVQQASELDAVFKKIADEIGQIRLSM